MPKRRGANDTGEWSTGGPVDMDEQRKEPRADSVTAQDYTKFLELLKQQPTDRPPTLVELISLRAALPPLDPSTVGRASLADRFLLPPFSVLDARQGYWQKRKRMWLDLGIQSELGRGENPSGSTYSDREWIRGHGLEGLAQDTHIKPANGLLGFSEQARSHYKANKTLGGSLLETTTLKDGKTQRGDGRGRPLATTFGSGGPGDLAAGFAERKADAIPGGGGGPRSAHRLFSEAMGRRQAERQSASADGLTVGVTRDAYRDPNGETTPAQSGTSIFDPVLCEIAYRWFCPQAGRVLDPFAGGSVRGIVAARLGRAYAGVDLRPEQAEANYQQAERLCPDADVTWAVGDSVGIEGLLPGKYDLLFSCPPYADLERYSDDPRDLSTMGYEQFLGVYGRIIAASCAMLKEDRFAVFVVGDVRDRATGLYRNFPGDTVRLFREAGLELYNEAVLVTAVGSLPIRVGKQFAGARKLGKTHQNVLVFVKGDPTRATKACGDVDVGDLEMPPCVEGGAALVCVEVVGTVAEPCLIDRGAVDIEVGHVHLPPVESYLLVDVLRGQARAEGQAPPRAWVGEKDGRWRCVNSGEELTHLVGGVPYLNRTVFPTAQGPQDSPPTPYVLD